MKWLGLLFPFLYKYLNTPTSESQMSLKATALDVYDAITLKSRGVVFIFIGAIAGFAILCGSFFMFLIDSTRQYDFSGVILWNATLTVSSILFLCSMAALAYVYFYAWPGLDNSTESLSRPENRFTNIHTTPNSAGQKSPTAIENALSLLVLDYIQDRQERREARHAARANAPKQPEHTNSGTQTSQKSYSPYGEQKRSDPSDESPLDRYPDSFH